MRFNIIAVGKLSQGFLKDGANEYLKRLSRFGEVNITEIAESVPNSDGKADELRAIEKEGEAILKRLSGFVVALAIEGKDLSSTELATFVREKEQTTSAITFVIGGSLGLSDNVLKRADFLLGFGKKTYPHQLMRVILLEQLYRSCMINGNSKYHK